MTTCASLKYERHLVVSLGDGCGCREIKCISNYTSTGMLSWGSRSFLTGLSGCVLLKCSSCLFFTLSCVFLRRNPVLIKSHCECWTFLKKEENTNVTHSVCHKLVTPCHAHIEHVQITHAFWACVSSINGVRCLTWAACILPLPRDTEKDNASDDK